MSDFEYEYNSDNNSDDFDYDNLNYISVEYNYIFVNTLSDDDLSTVVGEFNDKIEEIKFPSFGKKLEAAILDIVHAFGFTT